MTILRNRNLNLSVLKDLWMNESVGYKSDKQTHHSLCVLGAGWLIRNHKCRAILVERGGCSEEMPDVLGFHYAESFLLEAKCSRADFLADKNKQFREYPFLGVGKYRYYICPKDLISADEIPENWGLLYVSKGGIIRKIKDASPFEVYAKDQEYLLLTSALATPWKLFQHWTDAHLEKLWKINWMSETMGLDIKQFAARIASNRIDE